MASDRAERQKVYSDCRIKRVFRSSMTRLYVRFILSFKKEWSMSAYVFCGISINISSHTVSHRAWPHVIPLCAEGNHEVSKCHLKLKGAGTMYVTIIRRFFRELFGSFGRKHYLCTCYLKSKYYEQQNSKRLFCRKQAY